MNAFKSGSLYQFREHEPFLAELNFRAINRKKVPASFFLPSDENPKKKIPCLQGDLQDSILVRSGKLLFKTPAISGLPVHIMQGKHPKKTVLFLSILSL